MSNTVLREATMSLRIWPVWTFAQRPIVPCINPIEQYKFQTKRNFSLLLFESSYVLSNALLSYFDFTEFLSAKFIDLISIALFFSNGIGSLIDLFGRVLYLIYYGNYWLRILSVMSLTSPFF
jgi:hypothetical protein